MTGPTPWWVTDPELVAIRRRTAEQFGIDLDAAESGDPIADEDDELDDPGEPAEPREPDPFMLELGDGRCRRELAEARDVLEHARRRYDAAILTARAVGYSWSEIGIVLGVAKQQLHRQCRTRQRGRP